MAGRHAAFLQARCENRLKSLKEELKQVENPCLAIDDDPLLALHLQAKSPRRVRRCARADWRAEPGR